MLQALGLIETRGLIAAVESADAMLKAAQVTLIEKTLVGGGLVSIAVTGEVSAVKAAVDAGAAAVEQINSALLVSQHVIPRPDQELESLIFSVKPQKNVELQSFESLKDEPKDSPVVEVVKVDPEEAAVESESVEETRSTPYEIDLEETDKNTIDLIVHEYGVEEALKSLGKLRVTKLRNLAREYKELGITGRLISKADKKTLLTSLKEYYDKITNTLD